MRIKQLLAQDHASYTCGYCGQNIAGDAFKLAATNRKFPLGPFALCPSCDRIANFDGAVQLPPLPPPGRTIEGLPPDVARLYQEIRVCIGGGAYTAAVLTGRTLLMHVCVDKGDTEGKAYAGYVDFLDVGGFLPAGAKAWVDRIRKFGNAGAHKAPATTNVDARGMLSFVELLLANVYEAHERLKQHP